MATDHFIDVRGIRHHYVESGVAGANAVILIHGLTQAARSFDEIAPVLAAKYRVIAYDVRGRGESNWGPPEEYAAPHYAADLVELLRLLAIERYSLVGTSMGGVVAIFAAGTGMVRPQRMAINDIGPAIDPAGLRRIADYVGEAPTEFPSLEAATAWFREHYQTMERLPLPDAQGAVGALVKQDGGRWVFRYDPVVRAQSAAMDPEAVAGITMWDQWDQISCPVLVLRGAESDILSKETAQRMATTGPRAEVVEVPGIGHAPSLGEPEAVAAISRFFNL